MTAFEHSSPLTTVTPGAGEARQQASPARVALATAGVALVVWLGFALYLVTQAGASETRWGRIAWVFGSVQSIGFAAAGVLFGATVNRDRAARAEQLAEANRRDAESGRALAAALKADGDAQDLPSRHAQLAHHLFPSGARTAGTERPAGPVPDRPARATPSTDAFAAQ